MRQIKRTWVAICIAVLAMAGAVRAAGPARIGTASASFGAATIDGRRLNIGAPVFEGSRIVTGATDSASVLLSSNVVLKFDANTSATVSEARGTHVQLQQGNVEVFMAKRMPGQGAVALSDPDATIEALGTVFIASYSPATRDGWYSTLESTRPQGIRVKGNADAAFSDVIPGKHAMVHAGKLTGIADNNANEVKQHQGKIANMDLLMNRQAGTFARQHIVLAAAQRLAVTNGRQITYSNGNEISLGAQSQVLTDSVQFKTVNGLVEAGVISSSNFGGGGGGTGGGGSTGPSTGGFTTATVTLDSGQTLSFRLFDTGIQDGDQVSLKLNDNGRTILSIPQVTLTNAGQIFSEKLSPGNVSLVLTALNEGTIPPNTGGVSILSSVQSGQGAQSYGISTGQTAVLRLKVK